jgi:hypothetical protein
MFYYTDVKYTLFKQTQTNFFSIRFFVVVVVFLRSSIMKGETEKKACCKLVRYVCDNRHLSRSGKWVVIAAFYSAHFLRFFHDFDCYNSSSG